MPSLCYTAPAYKGMRTFGRASGPTADAPQRFPLLQNFEARLLIQRMVESLMMENFVHPRYSLRQLSRDSGYTINVLSAYFNEVRGTSFTDYVNELRVGHCEQLMLEGTASDLNLKGLASLGGFNNRNTFTTAFKKWRRRTPSQYLQFMKAAAQGKQAVQVCFPCHMLQWTCYWPGGVVQ